MSDLEIKKSVPAQFPVMDVIFGNSHTVRCSRLYYSIVQRRFAIGDVLRRVLPVMDVMIFGNSAYLYWR